MDKQRSNAFMLKVVGDVATTLAATLLIVWDRTRLFKAMAGAGSLTGTEEQLYEEKAFGRLPAPTSGRLAARCFVGQEGDEAETLARSEATAERWLPSHRRSSRRDSNPSLDTQNGR
jgi:hypothetical protein